LLREAREEVDRLRAENDRLRAAREVALEELATPIDRSAFLRARMAYLAHMRGVLKWGPKRMILAVNIDDVAHAKRLLAGWDERAKKADDD
jgi:hypothetical protein